MFGGRETGEPKEQNGKPWRKTQEKKPGEKNSQKK